ncbi:MAG TPA: nitrilase-related carbon-nitrogen hydrolase [Pseudonocardia sp.]|jgi:predicted amidohydrolase|uniref:nitrilase-related carbon-nitrogen hydrolase n=1 Tax=Pseudonocardia sp. TaxID=60912 RepID=UPI002F3FF938
MSGVVRAAAVQLRIDVDDPDGNRARAAEAVADAAASGAQLVVLPELACTGYVFTDRAESRRRAEPRDGRTLSAWRDLSARHRLVLVGGFAELGEDGEVYNSAALCDGGELRAVYRKAHLWDQEAEHFRPGDQRPPVLATSAGRVGLMICYDLEFPEWTRLVALAGAQVLAAPTNWPAALPRPAGERAIEVVRVQASASVNRLFVVAADRCGPERGVDWVGGSVIANPDGYPLAGPPATPTPALLLADLDLTQADDKATGPRNDVFTDRRPHLYEP